MKVKSSERSHSNLAVAFFLFMRRGSHRGKVSSSYVELASLSDLRRVGVAEGPRKKDCVALVSRGSTRKEVVRGDLQYLTMRTSLTANSSDGNQWS